MPLGPSTPIFGTVGIAAGAPFTIGQIPVIVNDVPPVIADSLLRQVAGPPVAIIVGATDPAAAATETLRTQGGIISQAPGFAGSVILGQGATVNSSDNVAIGHNASATSATSMAVGSGAAASGNVSVALGNNAVANGGGGVGGAVAVGAGASAVGVGNIALGSGASASGTASIAIGRSATANVGSAIVISPAGGATANGFRAIILSGAVVTARDNEQIWIHAAGTTPNTVGATGGVIFIGGSNSGVAVTHANVIIIGMNQGSFAANCAVIGGAGTIIATMVIGAGNTSTTQKPVTIRLTDRTGAGDLPGSSLTIRPGAGVGADLTTGFIALQSPAAAAAGVTQGFVSRMFVNPGGGVTIEAPDVAGAGVASLRLNGLTSGAAAAIGTLNNAPAAGNPAFWLPINIAGTVRYIPCW